MSEINLILWLWSKRVDTAGFKISLSKMKAVAHSDDDQSTNVLLSKVNRMRLHANCRKRSEVKGVTAAEQQLSSEMILYGFGSLTDLKSRLLFLSNTDEVRKIITKFSVLA